MAHSKAINQMHIALQTVIVTSYEAMIKQGRKEMLRAWGEAYEKLQLLKAGITI